MRWCICSCWRGACEKKKKGVLEGMRSWEIELQAPLAGVTRGVSKDGGQVVANGPSGETGAVTMNPTLQLEWGERGTVGNKHTPGG